MLQLQPQLILCCRSALRDIASPFHFPGCGQEVALVQQNPAATTLCWDRSRQPLSNLGSASLARQVLG